MHVDTGKLSRSAIVRKGLKDAEEFLLRVQIYKPHMLRIQVPLSLGFLCVNRELFNNSQLGDARVVSTGL